MLSSQQEMPELMSNQAAAKDSEQAARPSSARRSSTGRSWLLGAANILATLIILALLATARQYALELSQPRLPTAVPTLMPTFTPEVALPPFNLTSLSPAGLMRSAQLHTTLPDFSAFEIREYEVQKGDTLIGIAELFGIKSQTILWGNYDRLFDDPHNLRVGMNLRIMPVDGVLYTWTKDDGLNGVSSFFKVTPDDIINWPGNHLNPETIGDLSHPNIEVGSALFVPGGERDFIGWTVPTISRSEPAKARLLGPGFCGAINGGAVGSGAFVWPSTNHDISGYNYSPEINHWGIDIAGQLGNPVYATDAGVVVYAGWNNNGYGNLVVIDHGNGWQSLYGHLSAIFVGCGASVSQGGQIGTVGSTGNSTGPHLHFEVSINGVRVNPLSLTQ